MIGSTVIRQAVQLCACRPALDWVRERPRTLLELAQHCPAWAQWYLRHCARRPPRSWLTHPDFRVRIAAGVRDLSDANLRDANLRGADLRWANLSGSNLSGADLRWANLLGANLSKAYLRWADLSDADLRDADLSWADLSWSNLSDADLRGARRCVDNPVPDGWVLRDGRLQRLP